MREKSSDVAARTSAPSASSRARGSPRSARGRRRARPSSSSSSASRLPMTACSTSSRTRFEIRPTSRAPSPAIHPFQVVDERAQLALGDAGSRTGPRAAAVRAESSHQRPSVSGPGCAARSRRAGDLAELRQQAEVQVVRGRARASPRARASELRQPLLGRGRLGERRGERGAPAGAGELAGAATTPSMRSAADDDDVDVERRRSGSPARRRST